MTVIKQLMILAMLTFINAFFAASEMAMVSIQKSRVAQLKNENVKGATKLYKLMQNPNRFLSTIQVGITLAGFFASALAASNFSKKLGVYLMQLGIPYAENFAFILITLLLSYFTLVFGELFPKNIALAHSETIALKSAKIIAFISFIATPFVWLLAQSTSLLMKLFNIPQDPIDEQVTRESLRRFVNAGRRQGHIDKDEEFLIRRVIDLDEIYVREIMVLREAIFAIDIEDWQNEDVARILTSGYSRIPLYRGQIDEVVGILLVKDLLKYGYQNSFEKIDPSKLMREAIVISEHRLIDDVLRYFQTKKIHMAMVVDEYGLVKGMVTIEDILEEIVGEIDDEFDNPAPQFRKIEGGYKVRGTISLHALNRALSLTTSSHLVDTLNGYLHEKHPQEALQEGAVLDFYGYRLHIEKRNTKRIEWVILKPSH